MKKHLIMAALCCYSSFSFAGFDVITLGAKGGIQDGNLTAFMLKSNTDNNYITLDAGSIVNGLIAATNKDAFSDMMVPISSPYTQEGYILTQKIQGYFISHAILITSQDLLLHLMTVKNLFMPFHLFIKLSAKIILIGKHA